MAAPTTQAIRAQNPTPMNPDTAGWTRSAAPAARPGSGAHAERALIAGSRPNADDTGTRTATGAT